MKIVVQIAAGLEYRSMLNLLGNPADVTELPVGRFTTTRLETANGPAEVVLVHGRTGKVHSAASAQYALLTWQPDLLVVMGTCGGIEPSLRELDVVMANRTVVYDIESGIEGAADAMIQRLVVDLPVPALPDDSPFPVRVGTVITGDRDITRVNVADLRTRFGALAGDWETGAIALVAAMNRTPCLVLRGVSDMPDGEPSGQVDKYRENTPRVMARLWELLGHLLRHNTAWEPPQKAV